jgi:hypothetical protein
MDELFFFMTLSMLFSTKKHNFLNFITGKWIPSSFKKVSPNPKSMITSSTLSFPRSQWVSKCIITAKISMRSKSSTNLTSWNLMTRKCLHLLWLSQSWLPTQSSCTRRSMISTTWALPRSSLLAWVYVWTRSMRTSPKRTRNW